MVCELIPDEQVGLAWQVGNADGTEPVGKAIGLGALSKLHSLVLERILWKSFPCGACI